MRVDIKCKHCGEEASFTAIPPMVTWDREHACPTPEVVGTDQLNPGCARCTAPLTGVDGALCLPCREVTK